MSEDRLLPQDIEDDPLLITPLLDLMFLVLIFFALNLSYENFRSLDVLVPLTENQTILEEHEEPLLVEVNQGGEIFLDENKISLQELRDHLYLSLANNPDVMVYVAGDQLVEYRLLMKVLDELTATGVSRIHLISEEE